MASKLPPLQYEVSSDSELEDALCEPGLKVVELYSEWCGSCKSVLPTFKRLRTDKDDEACLKFLMVQAEACNLLDQAVQHRGRSEPAFLLFRNGVCKKEHVVDGANAPALSTLISDLTPNSPDADEPEANPFYTARKGKGNKGKR